jgi:hypothetical protein
VTNSVIILLYKIIRIMATNITRAFGELRGLGYFARQRFLCCQTCAWDAIPEEKADKAVFYHEQDYQNLRNGNTFYLGWSGNGNEIVRVLTKWGLVVEWNGEDNKRIGINPNSVTPEV